MQLGLKQNSAGKLVLAAVVFLYAAGIAAADAWITLTPQGTLAREELTAATVPQVTVLAADGSGVLVRVESSGVAIRSRKTSAGRFAVVTWPDASVAGERGAPALPVVRRLLIAPPGATVTLSAEARAPVLLDGSAAGVPLRLMPVQAPIPKIPGALQSAPLAYDAAAYAVDADRPAARATVAELGIVRGQRLFLLEVRPVAYNPVAQSLTFWPTITVKIEFAGGGAASNGLSPLPGLDRLVLNPGRDAGRQRGAGNYLIVCAQAYESAVAGFAAAKQTQGFTVYQYSVPPGTSNTTIKNYIQSLWGTPDAPDYILLVGDTDTIPHWNGGGDDNPHTDLPYACMDGSGDWYPDIAIGRFPVRSTQQLNDVVAKTLYYEDGLLADPEYLARAVFMASEDNWQISEGTHNYVIDNYMVPNEIASDKLYSHTYNATTQQVRDAFNDGRIYGIYSGHGDTYYWADGPPFAQSDVRGLTNADMYSFVASFACLTGDFAAGECFMETWLLVPDKGALAAWGSSTYSYWTEDDVLEKVLFQTLYDGYVRELGPCLNVTRMEYLNQMGGGTFTRMYFEMYNLMGDPSLYIDEPARVLRVTPKDDLVSEGQQGGPFTPDSIAYELQNGGDYTIDYEVTHDAADWVTLSGDLAGTLTPGDSAHVTVELNGNADRLTNGHYEDTVYFTNLTDHVGDTSRAVVLDVGVPELQYAWTFDEDPGWSTQGLWAFGQPRGYGGQYGGPDPTSGHTGSYVYGYNLNGDYENYLPERHLTSAAIDCTDLTKVSVKFWRWLGVEQPSYDHAYVRVSNDGANWTTVWENQQEVADYSWQQQEFDISAIADGQPTVYLRWTMGTTDSSWQYCGWNIDDVELWGIAPSDVPGDLDHDGDVDQADLGILLGDWGCTGFGGPCDGDCDGDGDTDQSDLGILLGNWGYGT